MAVLRSGGDAFPDWAVLEGNDGFVDEGLDVVEPEPLVCSIRYLRAAWEWWM
jgi:hypothetical protein